LEKPLSAQSTQLGKGKQKPSEANHTVRLNANEKFLVSFNWFLRFFEEGMLKGQAKIIAVSDFTKKELTNYYKIPENRKIRVIHNGVDTNKFKPTVDKRKVKAELGFKPRRLSNRLRRQAYTPAKVYLP
jgi:glycosyltransferase involved in cell wall biosynthesis